jgi:PAS domain S-box-containing protein
MQLTATPVPGALEQPWPGQLRAPLAFLELLPVAAYACDRLGRIQWYNRRATDVWGRTPTLGDDAELYCGSFRLIFNSREISRDETPMAHVLRTGEPIDGAEGIVIRPDGSQVWAMVHIAPVRDEVGNVVGAINCFHDTTELHRVSESLRAKQEELEDFFENATVPLHIVSRDGIILRANKAELAMLGYAPDDYIGRRITDFHIDEDVIQDILACLGRGESLHRRGARLRARDGSVKQVVITSSPRNQDGKFVNTRCFTEDVTAEFEAKKRAAEAEERYRELLEALPAAVYTTDAEGTITYFNRASVEMCGQTPKIGQDKWCVSWRLRAADGTPLAHEDCPMAIALRENRPVRNVEAMVERPDGTLVPMLPHPTPIRSRDGKLVGAVNMLVDITDRKQAENRQMVLLRELNHRVKNNMQLLQALLNSARRQTTSLEAKDVLADASGRVAAMSAAQSVLYDESSPTRYRAREFLDSVCAAAQSQFDSRVAVQIETAEGMLSNETAMPLALIVNELLTNAAKHAVGPTGATTIRVGLAEEAGQCKLWVRDEGPGFNLGEVEHTGGLSLIRGLARQLEGAFSVESSSGANCVVTFNKQ